MFPGKNVAAWVHARPALLVRDDGARFLVQRVCVRVVRLLGWFVAGLMYVDAVPAIALFCAHACGPHARYLCETSFFRLLPNAMLWLRGKHAWET